MRSLKILANSLARVVFAVPGGPANFREGFLQEAEPWINSEYGGVGVYSGDLDVSYCFKYQTDLLRQHEKLCGLVYTQTFDVEYE